jgi:hypothetical protein
MRDVEKSKLNNRLWWLGGIILLLLPYLFGWLNNDMILQIGEFLGYKFLLSLVLVLIFVIIYQYSCNRLNKLYESSETASNSIQEPISPTESEIKKYRERLLQNLAEDEKETLRLFIDKKKKNIRITYGYGNVSSLLSNGIIYTINQVSVNGTIEYLISDWAWEMLNNNPMYLK